MMSLLFVGDGTASFIPLLSLSTLLGSFLRRLVTTFRESGNIIRKAGETAGTYTYTSPSSSYTELPEDFRRFLMAARPVAKMLRTLDPGGKALGLAMACATATYMTNAWCWCCPSAVITVEKDIIVGLAEIARCHEHEAAIIAVVAGAAGKLANDSDNAGTILGTDLVREQDQNTCLTFPMKRRPLCLGSPCFGCVHACR